MISVRLRLVLIGGLVLMLLLDACSRTSAPSPDPPQPYPASSEEPEKPAEASARNPERSLNDGRQTPPGEPKLSNALIRGDEPARQRGRGFDDAGLSKGEKAINFTLRDIHGSEFTLSRLLSQKPTVMVFGSFT